ncbi:hypothetical protein [Paraburkholderia caledonica]
MNHHALKDRIIARLLERKVLVHELRGELPAQHATLNLQGHELI